MLWVLRLKKLLLPPAGPLAAGALGWALAVAGHADWGLALVGVCLVSLYLLSAPWLVLRWLRSVDRYPRLDRGPIEIPEAEAIVILDGGRLAAPPEHGGEAVTPRTLERLDVGARLHRRVGLPILVTGYGDLMARSLRESFGVEATWIETRSRNTHENAVFSAEILREAGISNVLLVTHFWHMPRSLTACRHAGLTPAPVPAGRTARLPSEQGWMTLVPNVGMLYSSYLLLHEAVGRLWYRLRYRHG